MGTFSGAIRFSAVDTRSLIDCRTKSIDRLELETRGAWGLGPEPNFGSGSDSGPQVDFKRTDLDCAKG
jgi:hypothetical protein